MRSADWAPNLDCHLFSTFHHSLSSSRIVVTGMYTDQEWKTNKSLSFQNGPGRCFDLPQEAAQLLHEDPLALVLHLTCLCMLVIGNRHQLPDKSHKSV